MNGTRRAITGIVLSAAGLVGLAQWEGYTNRAVIPIPGDVPTLGFGTTEGVRMGDTITPPAALQRVLRDVQVKEAGLRRCITAELTQGEYDAITSLAYNVGSAAVCNSSIPGKLAAGQYSAACRTILDFDGARDCSKPKVRNPRTGKLECPLMPVRGLTLRRQAEFAQCMGVTVATVQ